MAAILAEGVTRRFGATLALDGLDLRVPTGTICGVLGPNGAGKTTAVRILTTLLLPDSGTVRVAGFDAVREPTEVRYRIGLAGQTAALDEKITARDNLRMFGRLYHLPRRTCRSRADELLARFRLDDAADRVVSTFSGGMRRRLDLAASLIIAPAVLFLDEPTTGLDPRARGDVWESIRALVAEGTTVLLTTQYLDEADHLADDIAVIDHGRVIATGSPAELKANAGGSRLVAVVQAATELPAAAAAVRRATGAEPTIRAEAREVSAPVVSETGVLAAVVRALDETGVAIDDIALRRATLDDVFLRLTGHTTGAAA
jgi:ABC-2 type transport system ATP-binding protein